MNIWPGLTLIDSVKSRPTEIVMVIGVTHVPNLASPRVTYLVVDGTFGPGRVEVEDEAISDFRKFFKSGAYEVLCNPDT